MTNTTCLRMMTCLSDPKLNLQDYDSISRLACNLIDSVAEFNDEPCYDQVIVSLMFCLKSETLVDQLLYKFIGCFNENKIPDVRILRLYCQLFDLLVETPDFVNQNFVFELIQRALTDKSCENVKYALFLLKRIVDTGLECSSEYITSGKLSNEKWSNFFLLFEIVQEEQVHFVKPLLSLLQECSMNTSSNFEHHTWILAIFKRAVLNESLIVKKLFFEFLFDLDPKTELFDIISASNSDFLFEFLFHELQLAPLFHISQPYTPKNLFGEGLAKFVHSILDKLSKDSSLIQFETWVRNAISFIEKTTSFLCGIYILDGISRVDTLSKAIDECHAKKLASLVDGDMAVGVWSKIHIKELVRLFCSRIIEKNSDLSNIEFSTLCRLVYNFNPLKNASQVSLNFQFLTCWLTKIPFEYVSDGLQSFISALMIEQGANYLSSTKLQYYKQVSRLVVLSSSSEKSKLEKVSFIMRPLLDTLMQIHSKIYFNHNSKFNLIAFTVEFLKEHSIWSENTIFSDFPILIEAIEELLMFCDHYLCEFNSELYSESLILLDLLNLLCVGQVYKAPVKNAFDIPKNDSNCIIVKPLLLGVYPSFRILDLMDKLRNAAYGALCQKDLDSYLIVFPLLDMTLESELLLNTSPQIAPLKSEEADFIFQKLVAVDFRQIAMKSGHDFKKSLSLLVKSVMGSIKNILKWSIAFNFSHDSRAPAIQFAINEIENGIDSSSCSALDLLIEISKVIEISSEQVESIGNASVNLLCNCWDSSKEYLLVAAGCIDFFFQYSILKNVSNRKAVLKMFQKLNSDSEKRSGIMHRLSLSLFQILNDHKSDFKFINNFLSNFSDVVAQLLVYGPMRDTDDFRHDSAFAAKIFNSSRDYEFDSTVESLFALKDYLVRVYAIQMLHILEKNDAIYPIILKIIETSEKSTVSFPGTAAYRMSVRSWCAFHMLFDHFSSNSTEIYAKCVEYLKKDRILGIRHYLEWALERIVIKNPDLQNEYWDVFNDTNLKSQTVCSFLMSALKIGLYANNRTEWYKMLSNHAMQWSLSNNYTLRICAQKIVIDSFEMTSLDSQMYQFLKNNPEISKNIVKIEKNYFIKEFDPLKDANVDFIFNRGLEYAEILLDERIHSSSFDFIYSKINGYIKKPEIIAEPAETLISDVSFQKKITPWQDLLMLDPSLSGNSLERKKRAPSQLIVVASYLSKVPNIAGLCRTCEIFNVESLVVNDFNVVKDSQFKSISVTSDQWIPLEQVKEEELVEFLLSKKSLGYSLVGLEQANTSVMLDKFQFPSKCALVLGKEKEGIPAQVLSILDHIVEIPQFGMIRSLNVHVSASVCIWEYVKQHSSSK